MNEVPPFTPLIERDPPPVRMLSHGEAWVHFEGWKEESLTEKTGPTHRYGRIVRQTGETEIDVYLDLDGAGGAIVSTGVGFFDHMLNLLARHSLFNLQVKATGDLQVDAHHTVE